MVTSARARPERDRESEEVISRNRPEVWLREQRHRAGLSQMEVANRLGLKILHLRSQIENGYGRVPSRNMADWARALGIRPRSFARTLLGYHDPALYRVLFEEWRS